MNTPADRTEAGMWIPLPRIAEHMQESMAALWERLKVGEMRCRIKDNRREVLVPAPVTPTNDLLTALAIAWNEARAERRAMEAADVQAREISSRIRNELKPGRIRRRLVHIALLVGAAALGWWIASRVADRQKADLQTVLTQMEAERRHFELERDHLQNALARADAKWERLEQVAGFGGDIQQTMQQLMERLDRLREQVSKLQAQEIPGGPR